MGGIKHPCVVFFLTAAEIRHVFFRMGYNVPTWFQFGITQGFDWLRHLTTVDMEFKKTTGLFDYHVRVDGVMGGYVADCHFEPSQSANPVGHGAMFVREDILHQPAEHGGDWGPLYFECDRFRHLDPEAGLAEAFVMGIHDSLCHATADYTLGRRRLLADLRASELDPARYKILGEEV